MTPRDDLVGRTLGKRYRVVRAIGEGGMGAVYEAEHVFTKRVGALKLLHKSFALVPNVVERFVREASAAGRIGNPHIVETFDAGEFDTGEPYIFMELLDGRPVGELIRLHGKLAFGDALEIVGQAAEGFAAAHAAGIVHRDVKPENLFVCRGEPPFVKVLDFGISKFGPRNPEDHRLTKEGSTMGTPFYMAPEQVVGATDVDARVDVYALGVVLYECVTGKVPFEADSLPALSVRIHEGDYVPPSRLCADAPVGFDVFVARAMARDPGERFQSMQAFRDALATLSAPPATLSASLSLEGGAPSSSPSRVRTAAPFGETEGPPSSTSMPLEVTAGWSEPPVAPSGAARGREARSRGLRLLVPVLLLAGVSLAFIVARAGWRHEAPPEPSASASPAAASFSAAPPAAASFGEVRPPPPGSARAAAADSATPDRAPRQRIAPPGASPSASRAKQDGLTEENPFAK